LEATFEFVGSRRLRPAKGHPDKDDDGDDHEKRRQEQPESLITGNRSGCSEREQRQQD
jgi:hypothetical protein